MLAGWLTCSGSVALILGATLTFLLWQRLISSQNHVKALIHAAQVDACEAEKTAASLDHARAAHDGLTREFHHRVKNSLQIIQSYLTLLRRQKPIPQNRSLAETEARVQVISTAYRMALGEGVIGEISMRGFLGEIVENVHAILCPCTVRIGILIEADARMTLDRAIPLGLVIVETITGALGAEGVQHIDIRISAAGAECTVLRMSTDDIFATIALPLRLMAGLQGQLGAKAMPCAENEILNWQFCA